MPIYKDNAQNRRLKRVGMSWGKECQPCKTKKKPAARPKPVKRNGLAEPEKLYTSHHTTTFLSDYRNFFSIEDLKKGQAMQFMTAMMLCTQETGCDDVSFDDIVKKIINEKLWFNPSCSRTGIHSGPKGKKKNIDHTCGGFKPYKIKKENVMDMENSKQIKHIKQVLKANVVNEKDYRKTSTRKTECSVIVNKWVKKNRDGTYSFLI